MSKILSLSSKYDVGLPFMIVSLAISKSRPYCSNRCATSEYHRRSEIRRRRGVSVSEMTLCPK